MLTIISGGQTGVDRAALDGALMRGIQYMGWCPAGGWAEDRTEPPGLLATYPLLTPTPSADPRQRTAWNVRDADATVVLGGGPVGRSAGTEFTIVCAELIFAKPILIVGPIGGAAERVGRWVADERARGRRPGAFVLNVAGPRESEMPGIYAEARVLLEVLFERQSH